MVLFLSVLVLFLPVLVLFLPVLFLFLPVLVLVLLVLVLFDLFTVLIMLDNKIYQAIICIYANVTSLFQYPGHQSDKDKKPEIPALVRVKLWLGLVNEEKEWHKMQTEGELAVYAETVSF